MCFGPLLIVWQNKGILDRIDSDIYQAMQGNLIQPQSLLLELGWIQSKAEGEFLIPWHKQALK